MKWLKPVDANMVLGKGQEWATIHVRKQVKNFGPNLGELPTLTALIELNADEIAQMVAGKPLALCIVGDGWPPIQVSIGDDYLPADKRDGWHVATLGEGPEERYLKHAALYVGGAPAVLFEEFKSSPGTIYCTLADGTRGGPWPGRISAFRWIAEKLNVAKVPDLG